MANILNSRHISLEEIYKRKPARTVHRNPQKCTEQQSQFINRQNQCSSLGAPIPHKP